MDWIRYLLIAAIIGTALLLLNEWTAFKRDHAAQQPATARAAPASPTAAGGADDELPTPAAEPDTELPAAPEATASGTRNGKLIRIVTDVLDMQIDLLGGDIVKVSLPKELAELDTKQPFVLMENNSRRVYVAQSGLVGSNGTDTREGRPLFTADKLEYRLAPGQDSLVVDLNFTQESGAQITKRFTFTRGDNLVDVGYFVDNQSQSPWTATFYGQLKRDNSVDSSMDTTGMGLKPFLGVATTTADKPFKKVAFKKLDREPLDNKIQGGWISIVQHYFISAWIPQRGQINHYTTKVTDSGYNLIRFTTPALTLQPGQQGSISAGFYAGPKDQYRLKEIAPGLDLTVDYGWLWWIAQPLFWVLTQIHKLFGNWGWSIILLTILVKGAFFKLSAASYRSMAKMRMVAPKMAQIREMYADDRQKQSQEMMALYQKEKVNPLGGCLPILIQMPVFIALYWVLMESVELRHAPWIGWIKDLSAMDPYFILPLIMGVSMFVQQKLNPPPPDPMQAKIMQFLPIIFTFFFLWFPAGLVLYWVVNNFLSILQQWIITRSIEAGEAH